LRIRIVSTTGDFFLPFGASEMMGQPNGPKRAPRYVSFAQIQTIILWATQNNNITAKQMSTKNVSSPSPFINFLSLLPINMIAQINQMREKH